MGVVRTGSCNRCGLCCISCLDVLFEQPEKHVLRATCKLGDNKPEWCKSYPQWPDRLMSPSCGFRFIDEGTSQDLTTYRKNKVVFQFFIPRVDIVIMEG